MAGCGQGDTAGITQVSHHTGLPVTAHLQLTPSDETLKSILVHLHEIWIPRPADTHTLTETLSLPVYWPSKFTPAINPKGQYHIWWWEAIEHTCHINVWYFIHALLNILVSALSLFSLKICSFFGSLSSLSLLLPLALSIRLLIHHGEMCCDITLRHS